MRLENHLFTHQSLTWADSVFAGLPGWCELFLTAITGAKLSGSSVVFKPPRPFKNPERRRAELSKAVGPILYMQPGQLRMQNKSCKWSHTVPHFSELLGTVYREGEHTQQQDDMVRLCKHTLFLENLSAATRADAVLLKVMMQRSWNHRMSRTRSTRPG